MTAEVVILNRAAVAVAADSAVTLGADRKVYKTANKIFPLSLDPPVTVMFYGAGSLGPIPWETIVQQYKRRYTDVSFATIEEYGSCFVEFLPQMVSHISPQMQLEFVRTEILWELEQLCGIAQESARRFVQTASSYGGALTDYFQDQVRRAAQARSEYLTEIGPVSGISEIRAAQQLETAVTGWQLYGETVNSWSEFLSLWFSRLPELLAFDARKLTPTLQHDLEVSTLQSLRTADWSPESTGMVLTGFGGEQLFPSLTHWIIDQVMDDVVKARHLDCINIDDDCASVIYPLAQQHDVARTLIDGIHPQFLEIHRSIVFDMLNALIDRVADGLRHAVDRRRYDGVVNWLQALPAEVVNSMPDELEIRAAYYAAPLLDLVQGLPKEHLAEMAETLVHLASFQEKFTPGADVVGGPIDVAVISRGEGLVWLKHKQIP